MANDQMRQLKKLVGILPREVAGTLIDELHLYNGDTTREKSYAEKDSIRDKGRIIFTTPDMVRAPNEEGACNARYGMRLRLRRLVRSPHRTRCFHLRRRRCI